MLTGDCNICINSNLEPDSETCIRCGLSRKNYTPSTNADRIRSGSNNDIHHIIMWWINNGKSFTNTSLALKEWLKQPNGV